LTVLGLPPPDAEPLKIGEHSVDCVWREHYTAALIGVAEDSVAPKLRDTGFEVVTFSDVESDWTQSFALLASALGRVS
jgi:hypothetical protein